VFWRNIRPPSSGSKSKPRKKPAKRRQEAFAGLHGVTLKRIKFFITTAVRISNLINAVLPVQYILRLVKNKLLN
jgi:uncharacterized protein YybS (DUF2232 family)